MEAKRDIFNKIPRIGDIIVFSRSSTTIIGEIVRITPLGNPACQIFEFIGDEIVKTKITSFPLKNFFIMEPFEYKIKEG